LKGLSYKRGIYQTREENVTELRVRPVTECASSRQMAWMWFFLVSFFLIKFTEKKETALERREVTRK
jgi:hypothetical protein